MLAYAANRPVAGKRQSSPNALLVVISAHVAAVALLMSAKMDLPARIFHRPPTVLTLPAPPPPPPHQTVTRPREPQPTQLVTRTPTEVPLPPIDHPSVDTSGPIVDPGPVVSGGGTAVIPEIRPPLVTPIRHDPRLLTPPSELKPPYPASKLLTEEEATLRLRLTIDERGRVTAVEPVGRADSIFLQAAQRHLIAHWRYQPATEDGRAVPSSTVITLRFQLDG